MAEAVGSVLYKGIVLPAKFYIVKGTATNAVPLLSYGLCIQLGIMHEFAQIILDVE